MNAATSRLLAAGGVLGLAAGLAVAPSAYADSTVLALTNPQITPTPVVASTGTATNACDGSTPGWVGATTTPPVLSVGVQAPASVTEQPRFRVLDETGATPTTLVENQAAPVVNGTASLPLAGLQDGHSYTWRAHLIAADGSRAVTPFCSFQVDTTPPTASVASTDFPASGSGATPTKYAGQTGSFTIRVSDPAPVGGAASGVACFLPVLNGSYSVFHCGDPGTVVPGADGTATVGIKPPQWGGNTLQVEVMDNAGNVGTTSYSFDAPSNPNPPKVPGDVTGDGVPDILLPDSAGNLQVISGDATSTSPAETLPAATDPGTGDWRQEQQVLHATRSLSAADDLLVHSGGNLYEMKNLGTGVFSPTPGLLIRRSTCEDQAGTATACPAGYDTTDWSAADQMALFVPDTTSLGAGFLITEEHGDLYRFRVRNGMLIGGAYRITTSGAWTGYDLIAPGPDATGTSALWARDRATGQLHAYPLPGKTAVTMDFSALADPTADVVAGGFTTAAYPVLGSSGDLNGDGTPDLWGVTADRHLAVFNGWTAPADLGALK